MKQSRTKRQAAKSQKVQDSKTVVSMPGRDSFQNAELRLGTQSGNATSHSFYTLNFTSHNRLELEAMYSTSWVVGRAVDCIAEDMTSRGIQLSSTADPKQIEQFHEEWNRLHISDHLCDTVRWSRLFGGAIGILLVDGQRLDTPINLNSISRSQFKGLAVLDRWQVMPSLNQIVQTYGPDLGKPEFYKVMAGANMFAGQDIHYSRIVRLEGQPVPFYRRQAEMGWGLSVVERLYDVITGWDSARTGAAQLVYKAWLRTYKIKGLRQVIETGGEPLEGLKQQLDFMRREQSIEGLSVVDANDDLDALSYSFSGLDRVLSELKEQLSGALQIPLVKLFGQSPSGFSSGDADLENYYSDIEKEQNAKLRTPIETLIQIIWRSRFGSAPPEGTAFNFVPLGELGLEKKASIASTVTTAVTTAKEKGIIDRATALKELRQSAKETGVFSNITDEDIAEAEEQDEQDKVARQQAQAQALEEPEPEPEESEETNLADSAPGKRYSLREITHLFRRS